MNDVSGRVNPVDETDGERSVEAEWTRKARARHFPHLRTDAEAKRYGVDPGPMTFVTPLVVRGWVRRVRARLHTPGPRLEGE